ncbi:MAG: hypothetical protein IJY93_05030 [Clostridia bacterium]|nr:hypothetical protein [Clostridia bacterium]
MRINKILSAVLALVMVVSIIPVLGTGVTAAIADNWQGSLSIKNTLTTQDKKTNKLPMSSFDVEDSLINWDTSGQLLRWMEDANGGYLEASRININYLGFRYAPVFAVAPGTYKFTGYFRTANEGEIGCLRVNFVQFNPDDPTKTETAKTVRVYIENDWTYVECYVELTGELQHILVNGGGYAWYIQDYCMDQFTFTKVDSIPEGAKSEFGTPNTDAEAKESMAGNFYVLPYDAKAEAKKYNDVKGLIINIDDCVPLSIGRTAATTKYEDIVNYAKNYEGTHVTDFFINVNSSCGSTFPSETMSNRLDKYYDLLESGKYEYLNDELRALLDGMHHIYDVLDTDYIGIWHEAFREIGINPWLSFRMNDCHDFSSTFKGTYGDPSGKNPVLNNFFYDHPEYYRVQHHDYAGYMDQLPNYKFPAVRKYYLEYINEALSCYDTYGIELDFMRECRLFGLGDEYLGIDILNQFIRDVYDVVEIYEEKYGHDIRIAARVPSDPMTCYEFGLDPTTWIVEERIDMIIPCSRYENNDGDIPVKLWTSIAHPHNCEVVMGIEFNANKAYASGPSVGHSIQTLAGLCSKAYMQGADKVYFFNYFMSANNLGLYNLTDEEKIVTDELTYTPHDSGVGYFNALTSLGSPSKLLTFNRRFLISYNDTKQVWVTNYNNQVPRTIRAKSEHQVFRIPIGEVLEGQKVYVMFSTDVPDVADPTKVDEFPEVFVNSAECKFIKMDYPDLGWTQNKVLCYEIPAEVHNNGYMVIEIASPKYDFVIDYMEIYVQAHD